MVVLRKGLFCFQQVFDDAVWHDHRPTGREENVVFRLFDGGCELAHGVERLCYLGNRPAAVSHDVRLLVLQPCAARPIILDMEVVCALEVAPGLIRDCYGVGWEVARIGHMGHAPKVKNYF